MGEGVKMAFKIETLISRLGKNTQIMKSMFFKNILFQVFELILVVFISKL